MQRSPTQLHLRASRMGRKIRHSRGPEQLSLGYTRKGRITWIQLQLKTGLWTSQHVGDAVLSRSPRLVKRLQDTPRPEPLFAFALSIAARVSTEMLGCAAGLLMYGSCCANNGTTAMVEPRVWNSLTIIRTVSPPEGILSPTSTLPSRMQFNGSQIEANT